MPPLTLTNLTPPEESAALDGQAPTSTEARIEVLLVAGLVAAIAGLYAAAPADRSGDALVLGLCTALIALAHFARFDLRLAWTAPVQLALVPTLFLLPA